MTGIIIILNLASPSTRATSTTGLKTREHRGDQDGYLRLFTTCRPTCRSRFATAWPDGRRAGHQLVFAGHPAFTSRCWLEFPRLLLDHGLSGHGSRLSLATMPEGNGASGRRRRPFDIYLVLTAGLIRVRVVERERGRNPQRVGDGRPTHIGTEQRPVGTHAPEQSENHPRVALLHCFMRPLAACSMSEQLTWNNESPIAAPYSSPVEFAIQLVMADRFRRQAPRQKSSEKSLRRRVTTDTTILANIPLPPNVSLLHDPTARSVTMPRAEFRRP